MPVYKAESYITKNLEDLIKHDLANIELIIVVCQDGKDNSAKLCNEALGNISNAKVIIQQDKGLSIARNTGLSNAVGEYIFFMDSDDKILEPGFQELLENLNSDVTVCKYALIQPNGKKKEPAYRFPKNLNTDDARKAIYLQLPDSIWNVWRYVCKREFLLNNDLFFEPGLICEDMEWTPRMLQKAENINFFETPLYGYFYNHPHQFTKRTSLKRTIDINKTAVKGIKEYSPLLRGRLIRESLYSISDYCKFNYKDRMVVKPYILEAEKHYRLSPDKKAKLYKTSRRIVPLYFCSLALRIAKVARGLLKGLLGPNKAFYQVNDWKIGS